MSIKSKVVLRAVSLLVLLASLIPVNAIVFAETQPPPVDMFQLPWDQGLSWVAIDGIDKGINRPLSSSHNYSVGGAIDFAPHNNMVKGEDTSNFWVTAAAAGTVVELSSCHIILDHGNGWRTQYQFLANIQVRLGDVVARNQRMGIIADGIRQKFCPGSSEPNVPHVHFMLRPTLLNATFAGWTVKYNSLFNQTTFTRNGITVGLFKPLINEPLAPPTPTPTSVPTFTPTAPPTATPEPGTATPTPTSTLVEPTSTLPVSDTPTSTAPAGPFTSTVISQPNIGVGDTTLATVSLNNVPIEGFTSAEFTCTFDPSLVEASNIQIANLFGADTVSVINVPQSGSFIVAIAGSDSHKATTSGAAFTFDVKGLQAGQTTIDCAARVSQGNNTLTPLPSSSSALTILAETPTPTLPPPTATSGSTFTVTPMPTQTPIAGWLTFVNSTFGFQFMYPPQGQIQADSNDSNTRINNLPIVQPGTNLEHKFMDVLVGQNVTECKSQQVQDPGVTITINGIPFLKQTGAQGAAGSLFQLVEYSTLRDGVCVNLEFVLQSQDPNSFATPRPAFDYATETALFDQIIGTYMWLAVAPTATPTVVLLPTETPTPAFTATPVESPTATSTPTPTASPTGMISGQVIASKPVTINVYDQNNVLVVSVSASLNNSFAVTLSGGTYTVVASASGFLNAQGTFSVTSNQNSTVPTVTLLAGDIDGNNVIDQFDALTIGMSYNTATPTEADLNNDGIINVLDLEALAQNYRQTGPVVWQ